MDDRVYHIRISPEVVLNDVFKVNIYSPYIEQELIPFCCDILTKEVTKYVTNSAYVYSSMTDILSGGTNGSSLLTGLTVPILLTETAVDIGYYNVFDGFVLQKETMTNFLFSADTITDPFGYTINFYNTVDSEFKKFLQLSSYYIDWGDGTPIQTVTTTSPNFYTHTYSQNGSYLISMSGMSPWGSNVIQKEVNIPATGTTITNPNGTAYFIPSGGSWSGTQLMYDYLFSGDSTCDAQINDITNFTTVPFTISGYSKSTLLDLQVYGKKSQLWGGKYLIGVPVTGTSGSIGVVWGEFQNGLYTAYTVNDINYFDYNDGTTIFVTQSSGLTQDMVICSAITKNEVLLNVIDEAEVQSNIYIERGKQSGLERIERLGEINNVGDLEKYGYGFFNIINIG
jgi:hypothetical protein